MEPNPQCRRRAPARCAGAVPTLALATCLCACSSLGDNLPAPVGLPQNTPARPALQPEYLPVHDMPPARDTKTLTDPERKKIEADLVEVRDRQERGAGKPPSKQRAEKQPPEKSAAEGRPSAKSSD